MKQTQGLFAQMDGGLKFGNVKEEEMKVLLESKDAKYFYGQNVSSGKYLGNGRYSSQKARGILFRFKVTNDFYDYACENMFEVITIPWEKFIVVKAGEGDKIFRK